MENCPEKECCPPSPPKKSGRKFVGILSMLSAFSAASFAGVGCLGCIPILGAILATTGAATFLDDHLMSLQMGFIAMSAAFSIYYFSKRETSLSRKLIAVGLYVFLVLNGYFLENRTYALIAVGVLVLVHTAKFSTKNSSEIQIVYFPDCDNYKVLKDSLLARGIKKFEEINSEQLGPDSPYQGYSSPSLLINHKLVLGAKVSEHSLSCSFLSAEEIRRVVTLIPQQSETLT